MKYIISLCLLLHFNLAAARSNVVCNEVSGQALNIEELELVDLVEVPIFLSASQKAQCTRDTANIITTITGKELLERGSRDLVDALELVPGFSFGGIMTNTIGVGVRGISDEGKVSVMVNGMMLTGQRFGTTMFGHHFPIEQIDRIEIIRGPSSILHGNFSELAMVNIITKKGYQLQGGVIGGDYGRFSRGEAAHNSFVTMGNKWDDLDISFYGKYSEAYRSDRFYTDAHGGQFDMADNNSTEAIFGHFQLGYKGFNLQVLVDEYKVDSGDGFADTMTLPSYRIRNQFSTYDLNIGYQHALNDKFNIATSFDFSRQTPWKRSNLYTDGQTSFVDEDVSVEHYTFDLKATYSSDAGHYWVIGNSFQFQNYQHEVSNYSGELPLFGDYTVYGEGVYKTRWANILAGLRFDWYTEYGVNAAPRIGLTKQIDKWHYKLLYSHAFHTPTGGNYQMNEEYNQTNSLGRTQSQIKPEKAYTYEFELGYQFHRGFDITANVFYTEIQDYFLYTFDENFDDFYINSDILSTWGIEAVLNYQQANWGKFQFNYSFYQAVKDTSYDFKAINSDGELVSPQANLGYPNHKFSLNHHIAITDSLSFNHTVLFSSERYGYNGSRLERHKPIWVYNTYLRYQNAVWDGLDVGLGLYDVFNSQYQYVQTFNGSHPALPGNTREVRLKASYQF